MKSFLRGLAKSRMNFGSIDISKVISCFALACTISVMPVGAQQIITDGNTNTSLNINGSTTDVTTTTLVNSNAFNSFTRFNVDNGNTVNLVVPDVSNHLINLIHGEQSQINGTLNSIKAGNIGGSIFIVNPYGIISGANSVVNVGSLTAITPTTDFMNNFFDAPGSPNSASVDALLNGTAPINSAAHIDFRVINAINDVKLDGGYVDPACIYTNAIFGPDVNTGDIVNLNSLEYAEHYDADNLVLENGSIEIKTRQTLNSQFLYAGQDIKIEAPEMDFSSSTATLKTGQGDIELNAVDYIDASGSFITSGGKIIINQTGISDNVEMIETKLIATDNIEINANGFGLRSDPVSSIIKAELTTGKDLIVNGSAGFAFADLTVGNSATFNDGAGFESQSSITALNDITIQNSFKLTEGSVLEATDGNVNINNITGILNIYGYEPPGSGEFASGKINKPSIIAGNSLSIIGTSSSFNHINYANLSAENNIDIDFSTSFYIIGDTDITTTSGYVNINADEQIEIGLDNTIDGTGLSYIPERDAPTINAGGDVTISSISDQTRITGGACIAGNDITISGNEIYLGPETWDQDPFVPVYPGGASLNGNNISLVTPYQPYIKDVEIVAAGEFAFNAGLYLADRTFLPASIDVGSLNSDFITQNTDLVYNYGVTIGNFDYITVGGAPLNPTSITVNSGGAIIYGDISTTGNILINDYFRMYKGATLSGNNITIDTDSTSYIYGGTLNATGQLTLNAGDILNYGFFFVPDAITANSLVSNFMSQGGAFNITTTDTPFPWEDYTLAVGNLDNITIGGVPLNPSGITLDSGVNGSISLLGQISTTGNINVTGKVITINSQAWYEENFGKPVITAGNNLTLNPIEKLDVVEGDLISGGVMTLNSGDLANQGIAFTPDSVNATSLSSDFMAPGAAINITSSESVELGNLDNVTVNAVALNPISVSLTGGSLASLSGSVTTQDISLVADTVRIEENSTIIATNTLTLNPADRLEINGGVINVTNNATINAGDMANNGITLAPDSITAGSLTSDFLTQNGPLDITFTASNELNNNFANFDNIQIGGSGLNLTSINFDITSGTASSFEGDFTTSGIFSLEGHITTSIDGNISAGNYVRIDTLDPWYNNEKGSINIASNSSITSLTNGIIIYGVSEINTGNNVTIDSALDFNLKTDYGCENINIGTNNNISAVSNLSINGDHYSEVNIGSGTTITNGSRLHISTPGNLNINDAYLSTDGILEIMVTGNLNVTGASIIETTATSSNDILIQSYKSDITLSDTSQVLSHLGGRIDFEAPGNITFKDNAYVEADGELKVLSNQTVQQYDKVEIEPNAELVSNDILTIDAYHDIINDGTITGVNQVDVISQYGDILRTDANSVITSPNINLTATYGNIGRETHPIRVDLTASTLNATAFGNIYITEINSDIDVGSIDSDYGSIYLSTLGNTLNFDLASNISAGGLVELSSISNIIFDGSISGTGGIRALTNSVLINADT
ncbi:MAG: leukotoxin LktA family filamentous adhesin, partial [Cyanobacteriota bacterium]